MLIGSVDPGLDGCHGSLIAAASVTTAYGVQARSVSTIKGPPAEVAAWMADHSPAVVTVEVARGSVASGRDADPVLRQNIVAGQLIGHLEARGVPVVAVASGGSATPWAWTTSLGVKGVKGPAARDELTRRIVSVRLVNPEALPVGPRGGLMQDFWDATGLGLATLDRVQAQPSLSPAEALNNVSPLEELHLDRRRTRKNVMRKARAAKKVA